MGLILPEKIGIVLLRRNCEGEILCINLELGLVC